MSKVGETGCRLDVREEVGMLGVVEALIAMVGADFEVEEE